MKETKNRNGFRRAALPVFAMLIVAILSLTTVTYAWFTTGNKADVSEFDMTIAAGGGLEITAKLDGADTVWGSTLDPETIPEWETISAKKLVPVSTNGKIASISSLDGLSVDQVKLPFFTGEIASGNPGANLTKSAAATGEEYLSFSLYFRNTGDTQLNVNLGDTEVTALSGTDYGHMAVRMAFVVFGTSPASTDMTITPNKQLETGIDAKIFEPNATEHTSAGINDYAQHPTDSANAKNGSKFETFALIKAYSGDGIGRYTAGDGVLQKVTTYEKGETYFTLDARSVTQVIVFLWIEGQDADCTNTIASNQFKTTLQFTAA